MEKISRKFREKSVILSEKKFLVQIGQSHFQFFFNFWENYIFYKKILNIFPIVSTTAYRFTMFWVNEQKRKQLSLQWTYISFYKHIMKIPYTRRDHLTLV